MPCGRDHDSCYISCLKNYLVGAAEFDAYFDNPGQNPDLADVSLNGKQKIVEPLKAWIQTQLPVE